MDDQQTDSPKHKQLNWYQIAISVFLVMLAGGYIYGILVGSISKDQRIDSVALLIIALTALIVLFLLQPETFSRLKLLQLCNFKMEMLEEVKQAQEKQDSQLGDIDLILSLWLPETELRHLLNLSNGKTTGYKGSHSMRSEIRRLRSMKLLYMCPDRQVGQMTDDKIFDLKDYVGLSDLGRKWVEQM